MSMLEFWTVLTTGLIILNIILILFHLFGFCAVPRVRRKISMTLLLHLSEENMFMGCVFHNEVIMLDSVVTSC